MSAARISFRIVVVILALMLALLASLIWISYSPRANQMLLLATWPANLKAFQ